MAEIINTSADCNVWQFMECWFEERYKVLLVSGEATDVELKNAFELIYAQYIDDSGLYQSAEFEKYAYIDSLDKRIRTVETFVNLQHEFINQFGVPFIPGFEVVKKYGHKLYYNPEQPDLSLFIKKLDALVIKESKYKVELHKRTKELVDMRAKKNKNEVTLLQNRKQFISMLNRLQQARYVIDRKSTSVEDLSIMIRDTKEAVQEAQAEKKFKTYR